MKSKLKNIYWKILTNLRVLIHQYIPAWIQYITIQFISKYSFNNQPRDTKSKTVLLLTWEFPPQVTGGVYRPTSWVKYANDANWDMTVLCCQYTPPTTEAGEYLHNSLPSNVKIHRINAVNEYPHPALLPNLDGGLKNAFAVYKAGVQLIKTHQASIILASGPPFHNFVAASWLAKQFNCQLVLDYRDEWTETPFQFVFKDKKNRALEKQCLQRADSVIFTTESQLQHAINKFPNFGHTKGVVIHNGWEPADFKSNHLVSEVTPPKTNNKIIKIAYLGNLGPMADPSDFFSVLTKVLDKSPHLQEIIKFLCIGKKNPSALKQLEDFTYQNILELMDQIPKQQACQTMKSVDLLLILNPSGIHRYVQGKLYEYIASGTPVLVFGKNGEMAEIVNSLNAGYVVDSNNETELENVLMHLKSQAQTQSQKSAKIEQWLKTRERHQLAINLFNHLDNLITPT